MIDWSGMCTVESKSKFLHDLDLLAREGPDSASPSRDSCFRWRSFHSIALLDIDELIVQTASLSEHWCFDGCRAAAAPDESGDEDLGLRGGILLLRRFFQWWSLLSTTSSWSLPMIVALIWAWSDVLSPEPPQLSLRSKDSWTCGWTVTNKVHDSPLCKMVLLQPVHRYT